MSTVGVDEAQLLHQCVINGAFYMCGSSLQPLQSVACIWDSFEEHISVYLLDYNFFRSINMYHNKE